MVFFDDSMGPCLGPLLGGWISVGTHNWRWIYWTLFIFLGVVFLFTCLAPETYAPILLKRKAARLRKEHSTNAYKSEIEMRKSPLSTTLKIALTRPFIFMFCEPIVLCMSIYLSFIYSLLYLLFFAFPIAFEEVRGWNEGLTGTAFVAVMVSGDLSGYQSARLIALFPCSWASRSPSSPCNTKKSCTSERAGMAQVQKPGYTR
jgi:MFS family permease